MEAKKWKSKLKKACIDAGTYDKKFEILIEEAATVLELRDRAYWEFVNVYDGQIVTTHTNQAGAENLTRNPAVIELENLWGEVRAHLRELGLSPKGFKDIGNEIGKKDADTFEKLFSDLGI